MNNNYKHPGMKNEGVQPYVGTLEAEQELHAYELENSRPAVECLPATPNYNLNYLPPDFKEFADTQETQIQQELYNRQERPVSSTYTKLCDLRDKLSSQRVTLMSQLKQVGEQLKKVNQQLDKFS
ncbi:hypothetical protein IQ255_28475 [Pleurocapsales cyanobacterium LEGE 10410]|nr:hypothetical protein [Pleurocapsales cyanobacterium LEGE 10410]